MKIKLPIIFIIALLLLCSLTACVGDRTVKDIIVTEGLKESYSIGEVPDFSGVKALIVYSDDSTKEVTADELIFGSLDTSTPGSKTLTIEYKEDRSFQKVFTTTKTLFVVGVGFDPTKVFIQSVNLPDSLNDFSLNKEGFINKSHSYVVGDDNHFLFKLKIYAKNAEGIPQPVYSYASSSTVYIAGSSTPLEGDELNSYVSIDEENNAFDFTEAAIGKSFTIATRPRDGAEGRESEFTKSFTVTVVDGYNIYNAYELNYITNYVDGFNFAEVDANETRNLPQIVDDFLLSEKNATRPQNLSAVVIHNHLSITPNDLPREYFVEKNRSKELLDNFSVFYHATTEAAPHFAIHGNYFTISSSALPIIAATEENEDMAFSNTELFAFTTDVEKDLNFDHTKFSTTINNLQIKDDNSTSNDESKTDKAILGLVGFRTMSQVLNLDNVRAEAFLITLIAEKDYQTVNVNECKMLNAWSNHIQVIAQNDIQEDADEPLDKSKYPRLTLNITKSIISQCGGPAIVSQTDEPTLNKNKHSGPVIHISDDSTVESWVCGTEAWFTAFNIGITADFIMQNLLYPLDNALKSQNSSIITERTVNGEATPRRYFNLVIVNLMVPDMSNGVGGILGEIQGKTDIDGIATIGSKEVINMDDYVYDGVTSNFKNKTLDEVKKKAQLTTLIVTTPSGGVAHTTSNSALKVDTGSINATETDNYITLFYYTMSIVFGNYHPIK